MIAEWVLHATEKWWGSGSSGTIANRPEQPMGHAPKGAQIVCMALDSADLW